MTAALPEVSPVYLADTMGDGIPVAQKGGSIKAKVTTTFSSGFCVEDEIGRIFTIGSPSVPAGPLHLILKHPLPRPDIGTTVRLRSNSIDVGPTAIWLKSARRYSPFMPRPCDLALAIPVLASLYDSRNHPHEILPRVSSLTSAVNAGDLDAARQILQGRHGTMTAGGNDVLAGLVLFHAWSGMRFKNLLNVARYTRTNGLSRSYLKWAALGQSIQPVHDLIQLALKLSLEIRPLPSRRLKADLTRALDDMCDIGRSSGLALLTGLSLAAKLHWTPADCPMEQGNDKNAP